MRDKAMTITEPESSQVNRKPTLREWDLICFVEEFWHEHKGFPSNDTIKENVSGFSNTDELDSELYSPIVRKFLTNRGIDYGVSVSQDEVETGKFKTKNPSRLSDKQIAVINTLLNPLDQRTLNKKLADLGVSPTTYQGWIKQKRFSDYMRARSEELFSDAMPIAHAALMDKVAKGDMRAIKFFYEMSGRFTGANNEEIINIRMLLARVIEILQRHLDVNTLRVVANELGSLAAPVIGQNKVLEAEIIDGDDAEISSV